MSTSRCPSCSRECAEGARFCSSCGARLLTVDPGAGPEAAETLEAPPGWQSPSGAPESHDTSEGLLEGQSFGPFRLLALLGRGGFGEVWKAERFEDGRILALKILSKRLLGSESHVERFRQEGRLAASLNDPHCVFVYGAEEIEGHPTIAMELVAGGTLEEMQKQRGVPIPYREAVELILDVIEGLEAAAERGIVHRDVKPSNCFVDEEGKVRIGDFGLSKSLVSDSDLTATGTFLGTPHYSSPEQVRGGELDLRSDLYSVGATLYSLLTDNPPHRAENAGQVLGKILAEPPTPFSQHEALVPKGLQRVVLKAMAKDPDRRYPSYAKLRAALLPYVSGELRAGGMAARVVAYVVDSLVIAVLSMPITFEYFRVGLRSAFGNEAVLPQLGVARGLLSVLPALLFFAVLEKTWGRTPGKALLGLRVVGEDGEALSWGRALGRASLFMTAVSWSQPLFWFGVLEMPASSDAIQRPSYWVLTLAPLTGLLALFTTARERNGWAGFHELASRSRVRAVRLWSERVDEAPAGYGGDGRPLAEERRFGPYVAERELWRERDDSLFLARDPLLQRTVWIHRAGDAERLAGVAEAAGSVRLLQTGEVDGAPWAAYGPVPGIALTAWVAERGPLGWQIGRQLLESLARDGRPIDDTPVEAAAPLPLSCDRIWVSRGGRGTLLPFRAPGAEESGVEGKNAGESAEALSADLRELLQRVAALVLTGESRRERPAVPLPQRGTAALDALFEDDPLDDTLHAEGETASDRLRAALADALVGAATLSRRRRLVPLAVAIVPSLFGALGIATIVAFQVVPSLRSMIEGIGALDRLEKLSAPVEQGPPPGWTRAEPVTEADLDALRLFVVSRLGSDPEAGFASALLSSPDRRDDLERFREAASRFPDPTAEEIRMAEQTVLELGYEPPGLGLDDLPELAGLLVLPLFASAVPALLLWPLLRAGPIHRLAGISSQTVRGRVPGRTRLLGRAVVAWSPLLLIVATIPVPPGGVLDDAALVVALLLFVLGCVFALLDPEKGLPERIMGLRLVPR